MTKALLKKQMMEVLSWLFKDRKTGKKRPAKSIVMYALLYIILFCFLGSMFYGMADMFCEPMINMGMGWFYWCLMGLVAILFGVLGSVFTTYTSLYQPKDNDMLLAMPIPPSKILTIRLAGVYILGLVYELIVMVPAQIVWLRETAFSAAGTVCVVLIPLVLSVLVLVLSAVLGWVVALIAGRLKHKNFLIVLASLAFIVLYYYVWSKAYSLLQALLMNVEAIGSRMKSILYPLYQMGLAAEGNLLSMVIFTAIIGALFAATWFVLSRSFLKLATTNRGAAKAVYKEKAAKKRTAGGALLQKEFRRFLGSHNYMLNCGLGVLFMSIVAVLLVWKGAVLREAFSLPALQTILPLIAAAGICMTASMNNMTAPSVSLEGKNLWLAQSFPVSGKQVLRAKLKLQLILTLIPAIPLMGAVLWLIRPNAYFAVAICLSGVLYMVMMAEAGLAVNLKMPNLNWTNEIVPIKQSASVGLTLFGGWVIIIVLGIAYALLDDVLSVEAFFALVCALLLACCWGLACWLNTRGARIFETL